MEAIVKLNSIFDNIHLPSYSPIYDDLQPEDINFLLFSCENEEREKNGRGMYHIPE